MKTLLITLHMTTLAIMPFLSYSQETQEKVDTKESQEIIIRQKGNKDLKLRVEINGDNITVNGKPLSEFSDKDVTINKRRMIITDGNKNMMWNFNFNNQDFGGFGQNFGQDLMREMEIEMGSEGGNKAFLGVTTEKNEKGALIREVVSGSAADKAGLKVGDIITKVSDESVGGPEELADLISFKKPGDEVKISFLRGGKKESTKAMLGKRERQPDNEQGARPRIRSFNFPPMTPEVNMEGMEDFPPMNIPTGRGKKIGLKLQDTEEGNGVKVINVEDSSAAATAGIRKDDLITEINGKKISNTDDAREELVPDPEKQSYQITVNRNGSPQTFEVKIPRKLKTANF